LADAKEWSAEENKKVLAVGPTLPLLNGPPPANAEPGLEDPCLVFLDNALKKYGEHSVLYISFGSIFFPTHDQLKALIETILALKTPMPFIITTAGSMAPPSEDLVAKIKASGNLIVSWAPQQSVLAHPATGWMLSHCGSGGMYEALSQSVPLICWPYAADQNQNASLVVDVLGTGWELLQIRTGPAATKAYRGNTKIVGTEAAIREEMENVLTAAQGEDGKMKREKAPAARKVIADFIAPGGPVMAELEELRPYLEKK